MPRYGGRLVHKATVRFKYHDASGVRATATKVAIQGLG
jgi:hypothetical protein